MLPNMALSTIRQSMLQHKEVFILQESFQIRLRYFWFLHRVLDPVITENYSAR
jgi:hypothetical protein